MYIYIIVYLFSCYSKL